MTWDVGTASAGVRSAAAGDPGICVHHGGHCYLVSREQAGVFLRRVQLLSDQGSSELVPLLHTSGVELLFIASNVPLQVHDVRDHSLHRDRAA